MPSLASLAGGQATHLGEAFRVNGVKVSAGRLGDAEKSSVKVTLFTAASQTV